MDDHTRPIPLLGDIALENGQIIEHSVDAGFSATLIPGLDGELQQRSSRRGHRIRMTGLLYGQEAATQLQSLQEAAMAGEELNFSANITTALDLQKVVISAFHVEESAGNPGAYRYDLLLAESPPLPPPAQVSAFGGLDDFGLGDLGFDTDILGDLLDQAGALADAVNGALDMIDQLGALANLGSLSLGGILEPLNGPINAASDIGAGVGSAADTLLQDIS